MEVPAQNATVIISPDATGETTTIVVGLPPEIEAEVLPEEIAAEEIEDEIEDEEKWRNLLDKQAEILTLQTESIKMGILTILESQVSVETAMETILQRLEYLVLLLTPPPLPVIPATETPLPESDVVDLPEVEAVDAQKVAEQNPPTKKAKMRRYL